MMRDAERRLLIQYEKLFITTIKIITKISGGDLVLRDERNEKKESQVSPIKSVIINFPGERMFSYKRLGRTFSYAIRGVYHCTDPGSIIINTITINNEQH